MSGLPTPTAASYSRTNTGSDNTLREAYYNHSASFDSSINPPTNINSTNTRSNPNLSSSFHGDTASVFVHRQNHNSSKLPAFRFADLKREPIALPSLLLQRIPPTAVPSPPSSGASVASPAENPNQQTAHDQQEQQKQQTQSQQPQQSQSQQSQQSQQSRRIPETLHHFTSAQNLSSEKSITFETPAQNSHNSQQPNSVTRKQSLKFQFTAGAPSSANLLTGSKRPASFSESPRVVGNVYATRSQLSYVATPVTKRRLTAASSAVHAQSAHEPDDPTLLPDSATKGRAQGQQDLPRPSAGETPRANEKKRARPLAAYKEPTVLAPPAISENNTDVISAANTTSGPGGRSANPSSRLFRFSGARRSVVLEMPSKRMADDSYGDEISNSNSRDRALRSLEGRNRDDFSHPAPAETGDMTTSTDNDNTADIFMRIAGEATTRRAPEESKAKAEDSSAIVSGISRIARISHRRPLSTAIASFQPTSPPQISRRMSDQRDSTRSRQRADSQSAQNMTRELQYRTSVKEKPSPIMTTTEDPSLTRTVSIRTPLKPSPITPRSIQFQDPLGESASAYQRRRQSITENNNVGNSRTSQYRTSNLSQSRTYNSSPLVTKTMNHQKDEPVHATETNAAAEGTESSSSTAAPSTVWDELDGLKSRIHRLELTGKMPATSGAAMSRTSADDRPPTATTNATTMSSSPKQKSNAGAAPTDSTSNVSSHRDAQPQLLSALAKIKPFVGSEVFNAIDAAANDALALSTMMGAPGQPGPISSGASVIGVNGGVTDRQLRRKADNVCRSLTELCIALADELGQSRSSQAGPRYSEPLLSPTVRSAAAASRRPSAIAETIQIPAKSPRAPTSLEQKRQTLLAQSVVSTPRYAAAPGTPMESMSTGRKSSLVLGRGRRADAEELEEVSGRRSSLLLRTRRAGTEESEDNREGRKTSLLFRSTRKTMNESEDEGEVRFRAPSRAITEVSSFRTSMRDLNSVPVVVNNHHHSQTASPLDVGGSPMSSALPRRRLVPSSLNPRISTTSITPSTPIPRRYLERAMPDRESGGVANSMAEKLAEERATRQLSLSQTAMLNRTNSLSSRRNRDSIGLGGSPQQHQGTPTREVIYR